MGDRHKNSRAHISGHQKRKLKEAHAKQEEEVLSQISKLTNYFSSSRQLYCISKSIIDDKSIRISPSRNTQIVCKETVSEKYNLMVENNVLLENEVIMVKENCSTSKICELNTENVALTENEPGLINVSISNQLNSFENDVRV